MARKTMAERYASQRSSKNGRRRALPRVGDMSAFDDDEMGGVALRERDAEVGLEGGEGGRIPTAVSTLPRTGTGTMGTKTVVRPRTSGSSMPRRAAGTGRVVTEAIKVDYGYVTRDLRRIATTAVGLFVLLIVLNVVLQAVIH